MKKSLLAVTLIATLLASSVMAADNNTPTGPDFGKLRESAAAPFRLLGNLIGGNKATAATTDQPDESSANIFMTSFGTKVEFRQNGQWISAMRGCSSHQDCSKWAARIELQSKTVTQSVDLKLEPEHDLLTTAAGFGVLAPAQAGAAPGVLLSPGEYLIVVTVLQNGQRLNKMMLGALTVTQDTITARRVSLECSAPVPGKKGRECVTVDYKNHL